MPIPDTEVEPAPEEPDSANGRQAAAEARKLAVRSSLFGAAVYVVARTIFTTLRVECVNWEGITPGDGGAILVTWHGRSLIPANLFRHRGYWALISLSRDGELQNNI